MDIDESLDSVQKVSMVVEALKAGTLKVRAQDEAWARELLSLRRGVTGLLDISNLSPGALATARSAALTLRYFERERNEKMSEAALPMADAQCTLFEHYEELFFALTGASSAVVTAQAEIKALMLDRLRLGGSTIADEFNAAADELAQFYRENSISMFRAAKSLGGLKVVGGGQRQFGPSALRATRVAGLYCDTQLIPDPVYPFLTGELHLNALQLQLAIVIFNILPLRPLVDARLPEPPIVVFPSFEESLEEKDAITQAGIASLVVKVVAPVCDSKLKTVEELFDYAARHEQQFLDAITRAKLFVPPDGDINNIGSAREAVEIYLSGLKGIRDKEVLERMQRMPRGVLAMNGMYERLRPQYHLMENANELDAQPMLSQPVHWYYFDRCAQAEARELVDRKVLSSEAFDTLRALQDDSLTWLANVPVEGLIDLRQHMEHAELRDQLKKYTAQLSAAGAPELEEVVREVRHGLEALIQRQRKAIKDIEDRYSPKTWAAAARTVIGGIAGASMSFLPSLADASHVVPAAAVIGAVGAGGLAVATNAVGKLVEKRRARKTMLGMLAIARGRSE
jgi:hypothetical protein